MLEYKLGLFFPYDFRMISVILVHCGAHHPIYTPRLFTRMSDFFKIEYYILCYIEEGNKHPGLNFAWICTK